jgi:IPT/TIG domain
MIFSHRSCRRIAVFILLCFIWILTACGSGSNSGGGGPTPGFSISISPSQLSFGQAGTSSPVNVTVNPVNGFAGTVSVNVQTLPSGVSTTPTFPLSFTPRVAQLVMFSATQSAPVGSTTIQFVGTRGASSATASLSLQVTAPVVSPAPTLRTAFANLDAAPLDFGNSMAVPKLVVYDGTRQQAFVSNSSLNEVDVFSTATYQRTATIAVPYPFGIDMSADGNTLYVGTFSDFLYVIDPQQLVVTGRVSFAAPLQQGQSAVVNNPLTVTTLSNGNLVLLMGAGDGFGAGAALVIWDPATNQIVETIPTSYPAIGPIARSADHSKVAFTYQLQGGNGTTVTLYDVVTNQTINGVYLGGGIPYALALNSNGSEVAVSGGQALQTYDNQLNPLKQVPLSFADSGVLFSTDGTKIYQFGGDSVDVYDSNTLSLIGQFSDIGLEGLGGSLPGDLDSTGIVYALSDHGAAFLDASQPTTTKDIIFGALAGTVPQAGPLGVAIPLSSGVGATSPSPVLAFGSQPGWDVTSSPFQQGELIFATAPPSNIPGPVNVFVQWSDGLSWLNAEDFSYGPWGRYIFETGGPPQGGAPVGLVGYGFGWNLGSPQVLYGSNSATVNELNAISNYIEPYPYQQLQLALMTSPPGSPGPANLTITTPVGTTTIPGGFHFMNQVTPVPLNPNNLLKGVWDESRSQIYFSDGNEIQVFSTTTHQFLSPIQIPNATAATQLAGVAITPDDTKLLVADYGDSAVLIINLNNTASVSSVSTVLPGGQQATTNPTAIAATNINKAFVTVPSQTPQPDSMLEIDLSTLQLRARSDAPSVDNTATICPALGGGELLIQDHGTAQIYDAAADTFGGIKGLGTGGDLDGAISSDGNFVAIGDALADGRLDGLGYLGYIDLFTLDANLQYGEKWHPTGSLLYVPIDHGFDILDGNTEKLRERVSLPAVFSSGAPPGPMGSVDTLLVDSTGQNVVMISTTGVVFVQLDEVPLGIGSLVPPFGGAGTSVTLRGSGFTAATTVAFNGTAAAVSYVDPDTLQVAAPSRPNGPAQVSVANSNGESYSLDAAFNYGSGPLTRRAHGIPRQMEPHGRARGASVHPKLNSFASRPPFYQTHN